MELLKDYFNLQQKIFDYFGYVEDWKAIPLDDSTMYYWNLTQYEDGHGFVRFHKDKENLSPEKEEDGEDHEDEIYTQRFLPKWVYRGEDYTMICVDTRTDGNKFLRVFDNKKELKD